MDRFAETTADSSVRRAIEAGRNAFGHEWRPNRVAIAPGRIELLGNHIDYNGGPVLAAAIDRFIVVVAADELDGPLRVRVVAADMPAEPVATLAAEALTDWRNPSSPPGPPDYVRGLVAGIQARPTLNMRLPASIAIAGDVPGGFGVSSSAALCVGLALALADGFSNPAEIVLLAQEAEHRAGTPCGTMDQSASVAGGAIAFDGSTLGVERLSPELGNYVFAVADSGVERSLGASSYPRRVAESQEALAIAQREFGPAVANLAALSAGQLADLETRGILTGVLARRARHVVAETARVREGRKALLAGDWTSFGRLMTASGRSSATLYEISHPRVEELVAEALGVDGVLGARMMGGGEGGAPLVLLHREAVPDLERALSVGYFLRHGMADRDGLIHVCAFAPGAALVSLDGASTIG
jgi:galactokinase